MERFIFTDATKTMREMVLSKMNVKFFVFGICLEIKFSCHLDKLSLVIYSLNFVESSENSKDFVSHLTHSGWLVTSLVWLNLDGHVTKKKKNGNAEHEQVNCKIISINE